MKIKVDVSGRFGKRKHNLNKWSSTYIDEYRKMFGKTFEDIGIEVGKLAAKEIASSTQPFGLSSAVGKKYAASIIAQANRAIKAAQVDGVSGDAAAMHDAKRDRRGRVPKGLRTRAQYKRQPVPIDERLAHAKKKAENAGMAKGAWIAAGEAIDGKQISRIPKWIRKHVKHGGAKIEKRHRSMNYDVEITNELSYVTDKDFGAEIPKAIKRAYKGIWFRMRKLVKDTTDKANRAQS
jgi:hypothetical protein